MPTLMSGLDRTSAIAKFLALMFAILPGVTTIGGLFSVPQELDGLVKVVSFSTAMLVLIVIFLLSQQIARAKTRLVATGALIAILAGAGAAIGYVSIADRYVVVVREGMGVREHILPIRPSQEARAIAAPYGGDFAAALEVSPLRERLGQQLDRDNAGTAALMTALLVAAQLLVAAGAATTAWKLSGDPTTDPNG